MEPAKIQELMNLKESRQQALQKAAQLFAEDRLRVAQWCEILTKAYDSVTDDVRASLPPLPGRTAQEMVPALFADRFDENAYLEQKAVLLCIQDAINQRAARFYAEVPNDYTCKRL